MTPTYIHTTLIWKPHLIYHTSKSRTSHRRYRLQLVPLLRSDSLHPFQLQEKRIPYGLGSRHERVQNLPKNYRTKSMFTRFLLLTNTFSTSTIDVTTFTLILLPLLLLPSHILLHHYYNKSWCTNLANVVKVRSFHDLLDDLLRVREQSFVGSRHRVARHQDRLRIHKHIQPFILRINIHVSNAHTYIHTYIYLGS